MKDKILMLAEFKGVYGADILDDFEPVELEAMVQEVVTGEIFFITKEYGMTGLDYDFTGSLEKLKQYKKEMTSGG